jgi:hypothetical protein
MSAVVGIVRGAARSAKAGSGAVLCSVRGQGAGGRGGLVLGEMKRCRGGHGQGREL